MRKVRCKLNCEGLFNDSLHLRPAGFIVNLCNCFSAADFVILRDSQSDRPPTKPINGKSICDLCTAGIIHGEEVTLEVKGKCEIMAAEFFKVAWENLADYADDVEAGKARLTQLIDETFSRI